jgi:hypothetical protein
MGASDRLAVDPLTDDQRRRAAALYAASQAMLGEDWSASDLIERHRDGHR